MNADFTQLSIPRAPQVAIDSVAKDCLSEGFNFPVFRLLNKQDRVRLSPHPFHHESNTNYNLFAVANSKGWFVSAVAQSDASYALSCSPLAELRVAYKSATGGDATFPSKRTVPLHSRKPNLLALACSGTRLFVCFESGELAVYDTDTLFSEGSDPVMPIQSLPAESGQIRCIVPNPGAEPNLVDLVAVVYANKTVVLYNSRLESQGGWISTSMNANEVPVAVAWSPKGKHLAIGLQGGDILTYPLTNKNTVHRHIPPTCQSPLIGLNWLSPGHTFRTTYAASSSHDCLHHIVCLDAKAPTATYYSPGYPFPLPDRSTQPFTLLLPRWDEDPGSSESKSLLVVGDKASVDLEVLGNIGTHWYQQSQENPLSLPLDRSMDDTFLLALDTDLTDTEASAPVMYTYLNDGTVQAWQMEFPKPYPGITSPHAASASISSPAFSQPSAPTTAAPPAFSPTQQPAFVPSAFAQSSRSEQSSAFGQPQTTSTFGTSTFGQPASAGSTSAFGQTSPSPFGGASSSTPFGQPVATPAFASAFGSGSPTKNAFGGASAGAFGAGAFGSQTTNNVFGGGSFGSVANKPSTFGKMGFGFGSTPSSSVSPPEVSREASMSDSTPSFGGLDLGQPNDPSKPEKSGGIFGSLSPPAPSSTTTSAFSGGLIKPPTGFGAFNNHSSTQASTAPTSGAEQKSSTGQGTTSAFGVASQPSFGTSSFGQPAFGQSAFGQSAFGQSSFGQSSFGQSSFGQSSFGQSSFSKPAEGAPTGASTGGFSAFASAPTSFSAAAHQSGSSANNKTQSTGGFSAFASAPTSFTQQAGSTKTPSGPSTSTTGSGGFSAFALSPASPFGSSTVGQAPSGSSTTGGFGAFASATPTAFGTNASKMPTPPSDRQPSSTFSGDTSGSAASPSPSTAGSTKEPPPASTKTPSKPPGFAASPPSSPDATPRLGKGSILSDDDNPSDAPASKPSTTPASSPFGNVVASGVGAFGNIKTSPSVFKPATGFGAFGSDKTPVSSPFFKASMEPNTPSPTAFAAALSSSAKAPATPGNLAFGSSSALGTQSGFTPALKPVPPVETPSVGGFGAFSGTSSAFGVLDGPKKSFGELLKIGDSNKANDSIKPKGGAGESVQTKQATSPPAPNLTPSALLHDKSENHDKELGEQISAAPHGKELKGSVTQEKLPEEPSFGSLSLLSDTSSFAEIEHEETGDGVQSGSEATDGDYRAESDKEESLSSESGEEDDDGSSYASEESSRLSDVPEEDEEGELEESEKEGTVLSPSAVALPVSRSPSVTPQPEPPKVQVTPSPSAQAVADEESTTPPGTPGKESAAPPRPASAPTSTASPSTPFGLGLGRPSTRPTRSSPLASVPLSLADEDEPPTPSAKFPVSPQPRLAPLPALAEVSIKTEESRAGLSKPPRPKTPPLLSAFGAKTSLMTPALSSTEATSKSDLPTPGTTLLGGPQKSVLSPDIPSGKLPTPPPVGFFDAKSPSTVPTTTLPAFKPTPSAPTTPSTFNLSGFSLKSKVPASEIAFSSTVGQGQSSTANPAPLAFPFGKVQPTSSYLSSSDQLQPGAPSRALSNSSPVTKTPPLDAPPLLDLSGLGSKGKLPTSEVPATPPTPFGLSSFDVKGQGATSSAPTPGPSVSGGLQVPAEAGMQRECVIVVNAMNEDLAYLGLLAARHKEQLQVIRARTGGRQRADLFDASKWSPSSATLFGQVLVQFEKDLDELKDIRDAQRLNLKQMQNSMLKAGTRKEEISRFNKAKNDKEFAKMLKMRTLGPEHLETQTQLRRSIKAIRDRIQKLENHLQASKKKLGQVKTGRPIFRAPSLDTINRTFRNIDLAVTHQSTDIIALKERVAKLEFISKSALSFSSPLRRDERLPEPTPRLRSYNVTPHVAVTTAAALNAERAAHRLKRALFDVRKEPLLNKTAVAASPPPLSFKTPQKLQPLLSNPQPPSSLSPGQFKIPAGTSLFSPTTPHQPQVAPTALPEWSPLPLDDGNNNSSGAYSPSPGRRGATAGKKHNVIPLPKKTTGGSPTPAPAFNWGPLPKFDYNGNTFAMVEAVKVLPVNKSGQSAGQ